MEPPEGIFEPLGRLLGPLGRLLDPLEAMHNIMSKPNDFLTKNPSVPSRLLGGLWEVKIDPNGFLGRPSAVCVCMGVCARRPANIEKNRCQKMIKILIEKKRAIVRQGGWPGGLRWALGGKTRAVRIRPRRLEFNIWRLLLQLLASTCDSEASTWASREQL